MPQKASSHFLPCLPLFLGVALYLLCLPWMELRGSDEAVFAAIAREMVETGRYFQPAFQGQPAQVFPLYPWLVCLCAGFQTPGLLAVRLPAVLAVFGMAAQAFWVGRRHRDTRTGALAAALVLPPFGAFRPGIYGPAEPGSPGMDWRRWCAAGAGPGPSPGAWCSWMSSAQDCGQRSSSTCLSS